MPQDVETSRIANATTKREQHEEIESDPIEGLAKHLHWALEKYDPTDDPTWDCLDDDPTDDPTWDCLDEHQREIYRATVRSFLCRRGLLLAALRDRPRSGHSVMRRHAEAGEHANSDHDHLQRPID
jgi:hypothetical protein